MKKTIIPRALWILSSLCLSIWLSWQGLAQLNFAYSNLYPLLGIEQTINTYAPRNVMRPFFQNTTIEQREDLFAGIVSAIQNHGKGLEDLYYQTPQGQWPLLTSAEITHLNDVAHLIDRLDQAMLIIFMLWLLTSYILKSQGFPPLKQAGLVILGCLILLTSVILMFGAEKVFYQLHIWIFPANHAWFFFYEDSLMSTLMKAPDLFAYIGALLLGFGLLVFVLIIQAFQILFKVD